MAMQLWETAAQQQHMQGAGAAEAAGAGARNPGKRSGAGGAGGQGRRPKVPKGDEAATLRALVVATARLSLQGASATRRLQGAIESVALVSASDPVAQSMRAAGAAFEAQRHNGVAQAANAAAASPHYLIWAALVKAMLAGELSEPTRELITAHTVACPTPADLQGKIHVCHGRQAYDPALFKITLSISPELKPLSVAIMIALQNRGASLKFGPAPPGPNERTVARLLRSMGEQSDAT